MTTLALLSLICAASADDTYTRGKELFEQTYFEQAAPLLSAFLDEPGDASGNKIARARSMLAQSLFFGGDKASAAREVKVLLKRGGDIPGEKDWPPDFSAFVAGLRVKAAPPPTVKPKPAIVKAKAEPEPIVQEQPKIVASAPSSAPIELKIVPPTPPPWYVRGIPFGIGHFVASDRVGGSVFLSLTVLSVASNVALAVVNARNRLPDSTYPDTGAYPALYALQIVSAAVFYLTGVASIIDGIVFVPERVKP